MKICLVASRGGHLYELRFVKHMQAGNDFFLITEKTPESSADTDHIYYVDPINRRELLAPLKILRLLIRANKILNQEKPDCYISTGALISIPVLLLGKLRKKKIIFVESFARVNSGSISGRIAYQFSDLFIVYWKNLLQVYPNAVYIDPFEECDYDTDFRGNTELPL